MDEGTKGIVKNRIVGKRYVLEEYLKEGGMADVWRAREGDLGGSGKEYAIKLPKQLDSKSSDAQSNLVSRFYREARAHYLLRKSPYIVHMFGFEHPSPDHQPPYLVLELMKGGSLEKLLETYLSRSRKDERLESGMPRKLALKLACNAVWAVKDIHVNGFAHRDLKPSNLLLLEPVEEILIKDDATLKLGDLGIIAEENVGGPADTLAGGAVGTWQYMSPEYLRSVETAQAGPGELVAQQRADIYALGLILFEMWNGKHFFKPPITLTNSKEPTPVKARLVLKDLMQRLELLQMEQKLRGTEKDVYSLMVRMLDTSPEDRPNIQEVEAALVAMANLKENVLSTAHAEPSDSVSFTWRLTHFARTHSPNPPQWAITLALVTFALVAGWWLRAVDLSTVMPVQALESQSLVPASSKESGKALSVDAPGVESPAITPVANRNPPAVKPVSAAPAPTSPMMPSSSRADDAFIQDLEKNKLLPAVDVKLPHTLDGESLKLIVKKSKPIRAPGQTTFAAFSKNTLIDGEERATIAVLLRHGESNYYSIVKGLSEKPALQSSYRPGERLAASREAMPVIQELVHCPEPLTKWEDLTKVKCRSIAPRVWVKK